jgi:uncharacterized protein YjlB
MPILEDLKHTVEKITGFRRPQAEDIRARTRKANAYRFADDGITPNNPYFPLILYRSPVKLDPAFDPAAIFEVVFASHGWRNSWRDGIYDFLHFHTHTHEVLGIARGHARVEFGGAKGRKLLIKAGDVVVLPAGTGHKRLSSSRDLLVVGAYPEHGTYDEPTPSEIDHATAVSSIAKIRLPKNDPVYGSAGPLKSLWLSP